MKLLIVPGLLCLAVPLLFLSFRMKGELVPVSVAGEEETPVHDGRKVMLAVGMACLLFVPVFKTITHLPPYMGILLSLGVIRIVSEVINSKLDDAEKAPYTATHALSRIDTSSDCFSWASCWPSGRWKPRTCFRRWPAGWTGPSATRT